MKIAVIGSGISGLSAAYFLSKKFKVDLFEKEDHFGGHSFTYDIKEYDKVTPVDLGFIVFNKITYPNLVKFFEDLNVPYEKSDMSFSVSIKNTNIAISAKDLSKVLISTLDAKNINLCAEVKRKKQEFGGARLEINNQKCLSTIDVDNESRFYKNNI